MKKRLIFPSLAESLKTFIWFSVFYELRFQECWQENRVITISPSCQLYFNRPPLTFGKMRSNRSHQPASSVCVHLCLVTPPRQPACFIEFTAHTGPMKLVCEGGAGQSVEQLSPPSEAGALPAARPAKRAVPKSPACCVFWQAGVRYRRKAGCLDCKLGVKTCPFLSLPSCTCPVLYAFIGWWDKI